MCLLEVNEIGMRRMRSLVVQLKRCGSAPASGKQLTNRKIKSAAIETLSRGAVLFTVSFSLYILQGQSTRLHDRAWNARINAKGGTCPAIILRIIKPILENHRAQATYLEMLATHLGGFHPVCHCGFSDLFNSWSQGTASMPFQSLDSKS